MKKNIIIAATAAASAALLCSSCQKQELTDSKLNAEGKVFTAAIEQDIARTTITADYKVNWVTGDKVNINGKEYVATVDGVNPTKATLAPTEDQPVGKLGNYYYALYPASLCGEDEEGELYFKLPATQSYTAGRFNAPMYAVSETENFTFKNICGVICLSLKGTDKVKSISVTANEAICGVFEMTDATTVSLKGNGKTVTLDCGTEGVQLNKETDTDFYIYLPPKDSYSAGMKIVVTNTSGKTFEKTTTKAAKIERTNIYTFNWTASFEGSALPAGALPGTFSTGADKKVHFSKGNMYWDGASFCFEANQYTIGTWNAINYINYFFWSNSQSVATAPSYLDESPAPGDILFTNDTDFTIGGVKGFRTLSAEEWTYILSSRTNASELMAEDVTVCGVEHCLVIAPDTCLNDYEFKKATTSYDEAAWAVAEAAGLVCLPPAGYRDGTTIKSGEGKGFYWSSTTGAGETASNLGFKKSDN